MCKGIQLVRDRCTPAQAPLSDQRYPYGDVILSAMAFAQPFVQAQIKENIKAPRHWPVDSPHKGPVTWKMFPFDDATMTVKSQTEEGLSCSSSSSLHMPGSAGLLTPNGGDNAS